MEEVLQHDSPVSNGWVGRSSLWLGLVEVPQKMTLISPDGGSGYNPSMACYPWDLVQDWRKIDSACASI